VIADKASSTGLLAKQGAGTLVLGGVSTYTGETSINNGTVKLDVGNNRLPTGTVVSLGQAASSNLGTLDLNGRNQQIAGLASTTGTSVSTTLKNTVTSATAATLDINVATGTTKSYGDGTAANSGVITGLLALTKSGLGTQVLGDANTYSGTTTISNGVLNIRNSAGLGTTANGTTVANLAALELQSGISVGAEALTLNGTGVSSGGALRNISGNNTYGGLLTLDSASRINSDSGTLSLTNAGTVSGAFALTVGGAGDTVLNSILGTSTGTLTKDGAGTLILGGASTYTGATSINNGTLKLTTGSNRLPTSTVVSLGQASSTNLGILDLNGQNQQIAGLASTTGTNATGSKNTVTSTAAATLDINVAEGATSTYGASTTANSGAITGAISLISDRATIPGNHDSAPKPARVGRD
jgi:autotransporter-associated beta strand protein